MIVICYEDIPAHKMRWIKADSIQQFEQIYPNFPIHMAFDETADLYGRDRQIEQYFYRECDKYQLKPTDLHKRFHTANGKTYELSGLNPKNKKYKCIIKDVDTEKRYKVSPEYVLKYLLKQTYYDYKEKGVKR